jgi:hypothetical protein
MKDTTTMEKKDNVMSMDPRCRDLCKTVEGKTNELRRSSFANAGQLRDIEQKINQSVVHTDTDGNGFREFTTRMALLRARIQKIVDTRIAARK